MSRGNTYQGELDLNRQIWYAAYGMDKRLAALRLTGVGFFVGFAIVLGIVAGRWLDGKLNSEPFWTISGLILGIVIAFYGVYSMLRPFISGKGDKGNS